MTAYTDFHYSPTGSGVISGAQVLEQTEQGINGLGHYVQDNVSGAIDVANQALTTAQSADSNATAAINLANSFNAQIITANQNASNALTTAQSAQNTANSASSLATAANNNATTALNAANSASAGVTTLTGTVNSLGNRMTAAENAINTNAGNITTLQNNLATTNANVTAAANAASSAQATATSAQSTATLARNQAYVLRYTGTTITGGGTIAYADIDNTDNIKAGDKIIDATGAVYAIASVDIANETVTVSASEIINLAVLPDLFNSANTWTNYNVFSGSMRPIRLRSSNNDIYNVFPQSTLTTQIDFVDKDNYTMSYICFQHRSDATETHRICLRQNKITSDSYYSVNLNNLGEFYPEQNNTINLGKASLQWNNVYSKRVNTQTLNGVNPGALSIFNPSATQDPIDVPNTWVTDGSAWNTLNVSNMGDGWICLTYKRCGANDYILVRFGSASASYPSMIFPATMLQDSGHYLYILVPVAKAMGNIYLEIKLDSNADLVAHYFIPSYGTV